MLKTLRRIYGEIRIWIKFLLFVRDPDDTPKIFQMIDLIVKYRGADYFKVFTETLYGNEDFKKQFESGYVPRFPTKAELAQMKPGTLGRALYDDLEAKGLDLNFFPLIDYRNPIKYIIYRAYLVHDISHLLLKYGTSVEEELALQGFTLAQTKSPISTLLVAGGILNLVTTEPQNIFRSFRKIADGFDHGTRCGQVLAIPFSEYLECSLDDIREKFNLVDRFASQASAVPLLAR